MSSNKTYIHYPADCLIEGKLWPHKIEILNQDDFFIWIDDETRFFDESSYQEALKLALDSSIPFAKEFVEQIMDYLEPQLKYDRQRLAKVQGVGESTIASYGLDINSEKIYEIEEIETGVKIDCLHDSCVGECTECNYLQKFAIIEQAKEEPQEIQDELWEEAMFINNSWKLRNVEELKSKFHIQRK